MKKIDHAEHVPANAVTTEGARSAKMRVLIGPDDHAPTFAMRQFEIEPGGCTPSHEHPWEHEMYFLQGCADVQVGSESHPMRPGSFAFVPPNEPHQVRNTGHILLKFLCLIPVTQPCGCPVK